MIRILQVFSPNHHIHHTNVRLDNTNNLGGDIFIYIIRNRNTRIAVLNQFYGHIYGLQQALGVDAGEHEATLVQRPQDARWRCGCTRPGRMVLTDEEAGFLGQGARVRHHAEEIHLEEIVAVVLPCMCQDRIE